MNDVIFKELLESVGEADAIMKSKAKPDRSFQFEELEVKAIREKLGMSQAQFAALMGISKRTLENWEQGKRHPTGSAKALLTVVAKKPEAVLEALHT